MKQGPFAPAGLCCPGDRHYYDPLRLPLGRPPFPGIAGYRQGIASRRPRRRGRGGSPQFPGGPSARSTPTTPEGSSAPAPGSRTPSVAFAVCESARHPLDPPLGGLWLTTLARASLLAADRTVASAPLRTRPLDRARGHRYRGPGRLPGPDSHRLAALSLSLGYVMSNPLSSWRPSFWAHSHKPKVRP